MNNISHHVFTCCGTSVLDIPYVTAAISMHSLLRFSFMKLIKQNYAALHGTRKTERIRSSVLMPSC